MSYKLNLIRYQSMKQMQSSEQSSNILLHKNVLSQLLFSSGQISFNFNLFCNYITILLCAALLSTTHLTLPVCLL